MAYFVTGGTGFIGRHFIAQILARGQPVNLLLRAGSREGFERLVRDAGPSARLLVPVEGDLADELLGVPATVRDRLRRSIDHFVHLGALYDLSADAGLLARSNVAGTKHALDLAQDLEAGCFHLISSIAVAGRYRGIFTEQMFEQAEGLDHPYFQTKHDSEGLVRNTCRLHGGSIGPAWWLVIPRPARWTRSTGPTIRSG